MIYHVTPHGMELHAGQSHLLVNYQLSVVLKNSEECHMIHQVGLLLF